MTKLHITLKIKPLKKAFFFKKRQHYRKDTNVPKRRSGFQELSRFSRLGIVEASFTSALAVQNVAIRCFWKLGFIILSLNIFGLQIWALLSSGLQIRRVRKIFLLVKSVYKLEYVNITKSKLTHIYLKKELSKKTGSLST